MISSTTFKALSPCPRGTSGRVCSLRLKRRITASTRWHKPAATVELSHNVVQEHTTDLASSPSKERQKPIRTLKPLRRPHLGVLKQHHGTYVDHVTRGRRRILSALQHNAPDRLVRALGSAWNDSAVLKSLPKTTFHEIYRILDPSYFISPYDAVYRDFSPINLRTSELRPMSKFAEDLKKVISYLKTLKKRIGMSMGVIDYTYFLKCARAMESSAMARMLWTDMKKGGIRPTTDCYNHYLGAIAWSEAHTARRFHLRVLTKNDKPLSTTTRAAATQILQEMMDHGEEPDEDTYATFIVALGREGDLGQVEAILKKMWNIDVPKLASEGEKNTEPATQYPHGACLRPTSNLLYSLAHVYGSNNEIPTALMLVDYVSQQYRVSIPIEIWEQLFEWTFVLAAPRSRQHQIDGRDVGQLPLESARKLWNTMTSDPYNMAPTTPMLNRYLRNLYTRGSLTEFQMRLDEGMQLYRDTKKRYGDARKRLILAESLAAKKRLPPLRDFDVNHLRRTHEVTRLTYERDLAFVRRWIKQLLVSPRWNTWGEREWERRGLPRAVEQYAEFLPRRLKYKIRNSGSVYMEF